MVKIVITLLVDNLVLLTQDGVTPLSMASGEGLVTTVECLLKYGADPNIPRNVRNIL